MGFSLGLGGVWLFFPKGFLVFSWFSVIFLWFLGR